jgi:predicted ester cyclase
MIFAGSVVAQDRPNIDAIVRQFHVNYSNGDIEKNGTLVDDSLVVRLNGGADNKVNGATFSGREEFVDWLNREKVMFSDGKITDHDVVVSGNMAAIRFTFEGTHTGPISTPNGALPATGRKVRIEGAEFFTFNSSGKLIHLETLTDDLSVVAQLTAK